MLDESSIVPDSVLMQRVQTGQSEQFGHLVRRYQGPLLRVARSRLGRTDWAEEVVQETFLAAFRASRSYDARCSFRTWLWTILLNECRGHYRRRARGPKVESWPDETSGDSDVGLEQDASTAPLVRLLAQERAAHLESLLSRLSTAQADALRLRFFAGLKFQEIAVTMKCSLNTAKNRVRWGLLRLTELLQTQHHDNPSAGPFSSGQPRGELRG